MSTSKADTTFDNELTKRREMVYAYLESQDYRQRLTPPDIRDAVYSYIRMGGKTLRPAVLLLSCGAVGGDEKRALPAAAAVEVYHTWTLVHDDIIDRDTKRRGAPTVHEEWARKALRLGYDPVDANHYGLSIAILAGDIQHSWAISLLSELYTGMHVAAPLVVRLIQRLQTYVIRNLVDGETLDIQFSQSPIDTLSEEAILRMLWGKTGVLYEYAAQAGAMIGLETEDTNHPFIEALTQFATKCGIAFQLQDDILGIIGDESVLGKPVGSDLREGKRTTIVHYAFQSANKDQKGTMLSVLGNRSATLKQIEEATAVLRSLGGIDHTRDLARKLIEQGKSHLEVLPPSLHKGLLLSWANYMVEREF